MIEQGAVVAATDYPGLGTPGPHPYLVGDSEARAVIDSVRAARSLPNVGSGNSFAVWGHSQGGQASLYTGLIAKTYAPELNLVGVAAAAPATSLVTLMGDDFKTSGGKNLTAMTLWSWARVYDAPIAKVVVPEAMPTVDRLADECIELIFDILARRRTEKPLEQNFLSVPNIATVEPWHSLAAHNTPGPLPSRIPLFLAQGTDRRHRPSRRDARLHAAAMQGRRQGHHDVGARRRSRFRRPRQRRQCGGLDDGSLSPASPRPAIAAGSLRLSAQ